MATDELLSLAEQQHGLVRVDQAAQHQLGPELRRGIARGQWERITSVVVRLRGSPPTPTQKAMAAVLDAGVDAALSHDSAAALWGLSGFASEPWHVTLLRSSPSRTSRHYRFHEPRLLLRRHVVRSSGLPVTTPARTLFDLAGSRWVHPARLERALDNAWAARLVSLTSLDRMMADLARRGRPGIKLMRRLLDERRDGYVPVESNLERRFLELCDRAGLRGLERQVDLGDGDLIGRIDFVHREIGVLFEIDSDRFHTSLLDRQADRQRDERIRAFGLRVVRYTEFQVWHQADEVVAELRSLRRAAA